MEEDRAKVIVQGVHIPLRSEEHYPDRVLFMTPFWHEVMEFYETFMKTVRERGEGPLPFQPYILEVCKEVAEKCDRFESADQVFKRLMEHFGFYWLEKWAKYYGVGQDDGQDQTSDSDTR